MFSIVLDELGQAYSAKLTIPSAHLVGRTTWHGLTEHTAKTRKHTSNTK